MIQINHQPSDQHLRVFAIGQTLVIGLLSASLLRRGISPVWCYSVAGLSLLVGITGAMRPPWARPFYVAWMMLMFPIGWIVSYLLLASVYWLLITPLGMVWRSLGIDPLERRFDPGLESYWVRRPPAPPPDRYFRQF